MAGRGDNNKAGSAGRGASNQSNQPFGQSEKTSKSNHQKNRSGSERSMEQPKEKDQSANRNQSTEKDS